MSIPGSIPVTDTRPTIAADLGRYALWLVWQSIRLPLFLFLLVLQPVVTFVLGALALLGVLTALFWKSFEPPSFRFFLMLYWAQKFGGNFARWALPSEAVSEHSWLEPLSIFRFLSMLAVSEAVMHPKLLEMWALDLASATLVIRTFIEIADLRRPRFASIRMGHSGGLHLMTTAAFFVPRHQLDSPEALNIACNVYGAQGEIALASLRAARDVYYNAFTALGISETALRALNGTYWDKTWDGAFSAPRGKI